MKTTMLAALRRKLRQYTSPSLSSTERRKLREVFDAKYYLTANADVAKAGIDPLTHYMSTGWHERRRPRPNFDGEWYARTHVIGPENPLLHWVREGRDRGLTTAPDSDTAADWQGDEDLAALREAFDEFYYLAHNPDVGESGIDPLLHYMANGWREGRDPRRDFDTVFYETNNDTGGMHPFLHWVREGRDRGLTSVPDSDTVADWQGDEDLAALREAFDERFYLAHNPDVGRSGMDPLLHYMANGWREGRDPRRDFDTVFYETNNDTDGMHPFLHWVREGRARKLPAQVSDPFPREIPLRRLADPEETVAGYSGTSLALLRAAFSAEFYLSRNPDLRVGGVNPLEHYLTAGWREHRDPAPDFSIAFYLESNDDIRKAGLDPFVHWVLHGRAEGRLGIGPDVYRDAREFLKRGLGLGDEACRRIEIFFDAPFYLAQNTDIREAGADPLLHFLVAGWREHRDPTPDFSVSYYLRTNEDIAEGGINPFVHWVLHGRDEGRSGKPTLGKAQPEVPDLAQIDWSACPEQDVADIADNFDRTFYLEHYPEVAEMGIDPIVHYLMLGWRLNYDPRPDFSTRYYRDRYVDIQRARINPFLHYCRHGHKEHRETHSYIEARQRNFRPRVSVILPNYNHARYLPQRIRSIAKQTYDNLEIIILDDKSQDDSQEVIRRTVAELGIEARLEFNEVNSGNVFAQWRKGLSLATGDLVWICESDDYCEPDFVERLVPAFADESVNIAFGRIQFCDLEGNFMEGLDAYREGAEPGIWDNTITRPAAEWFNGGFGVNNVYANVGGGMFRRMGLPEEIWTEARSFRICGDWFLYLHIAGAGQITFEPRAVAYFRQHGANTSASNFHQRYYYDENMRILRLLAETWGISTSTRMRFLDKVKSQYRHLGLTETIGPFDETFGVSEILTTPRSKSHVQFYFLGFYPGGGELFPINLANAFLEAGHTVSMVAVDLASINEDMRARLDRRIPAYHASHVTARGRGAFLDACGTSLMNSHVASADAFLYTLSESPIERPYVVTLHGSYVAFEDVPQALIDWIIQNVSSWIYTADQNLVFFEDHKVDWDVFTKLPNAMPHDNRPAPMTRRDLGIPEGDTVFTLVARGIKRKGWRAAVEAFRTLRDIHGQHDTHLLLIGEGEQTETARRLAANLPNVHFLGYQSAINGILQLTDCLILPSRFEGESYPLCLIQAIQEHVPAIATDIGEIRSMMTNDDGQSAGILLMNQRDSRAHFNALASAMLEMCDPAVRSRFADLAKKRARIYDMRALVSSYEEVYETAYRDFGLL